MRSQWLKISKRSSKSERIVAEILKRNKIKFKFHQRIGKYEADFLIGKVIFEIDGNVHDAIKTARDVFFANQGYVPIHLKVEDKNVDTKAIENTIKDLIQRNGKCIRKGVV